MGNYLSGCSEENDQIDLLKGCRQKNRFLTFIDLITIKLIVIKQFFSTDISTSLKCYGPGNYIEKKANQREIADVAA